MSKVAAISIVRYIKPDAMQVLTTDNWRFRDDVAAIVLVSERIEAATPDDIVAAEAQIIVCETLEKLRALFGNYSAPCDSEAVQ